MATVPTRLEETTRNKLVFLRRHLAARFGQDFTMSEVIDALISASGGNENYAIALHSVITSDEYVQVMHTANLTETDDPR